MIRLFLASLLPSLIVLIALPSLALSTAGQEDRRQQEEDADARISIRGGAFAPERVTIAPGQVVLWKNDDERDHAISADKGEFKSGTIKPGKSWRFTFEKAGTFKFHCPLHPRAKGMVVVER